MHYHCSCLLCFCHLGFPHPPFLEMWRLFLLCQCNFLVRNPQIPARIQPNPSARLAHIKQNHRFQPLQTPFVSTWGAGSPRGPKDSKKFLGCCYHFRKSARNRVALSRNSFPVTSKVFALGWDYVSLILALVISCSQCILLVVRDGWLPVNF